MLGIIFSALTGILAGVQGVFNTRVSEKIGLWETTVIVHSIGLIFALFILLFTGGSGFKRINELNNIYLLGGIFGVIIVFSLMKGISALGTAGSITIVLISQLIVAASIDTYGLFGATPIRLAWTKIVGLATMIVGILIFNWKQ